MATTPILLGVNIDHVATLRQARGTPYPDPVEAAAMAEQAGADGITIHLREDRRHIQDSDVLRLKESLTTRMNLEMAISSDIVTFAEKVQPEHCCLVPEKREELTTEGGLDVVGQQAAVKAACERLGARGIEVSLFIDPIAEQIEAAKACGAPTIEIHTGQYADAPSPEQAAHYLAQITDAVILGKKLGLIVNAGHGLHCGNTAPIAAIPDIDELNIGHAIVARAVLVGMSEAVREIKEIMLTAREQAKTGEVTC